MPAKVIFHIDMNAFFCSCECLNNPLLKGKPFAVGSSNPNRGVISTASYEARKYGVHSAMSTPEALRKCPKLILIDGHYNLYESYSNKIMQIFKKYTSLVEQASIDEAYLDVTESTKDYLKLAHTIQDEIYNNLGLPCSIGIGTTLFIAKMASDIKKPMGMTIIRNSEISKIIYPLPIKDYFGIGKKTYPKLMDMGIKTIGDLIYKKDISLKILGERRYNEIVNELNGNSDNIVNPYRYVDSESIGNSRTYNPSLINEEIIQDKLIELASMVSKRLREENYAAKTITVQIKFDDFKIKSKSRTFNDYFFTTSEIFEKGYNLLNELWNHDPIRLVGISCSSFTNKNDMYITNNLFNYEEVNKSDIVTNKLKDINKKYGKKIIQIGCPSINTKK